MISLKEYYKGRDVTYDSDLTPEIRASASKLLIKVNELLTIFGEPRSCNSGWRPLTVQMEINPRAPNSKHVTGNAIDLEDKNGKFANWCMGNLLHLERLGLYLEDPKSTPTWVHLQQVAPKSGKRVFQP